jgi:hypothetical protein
MKPLLSVLLIALAGCSGFHFFSNFPATSVTSVSGFVTIVHLGSVANDGTFISVTSVTFVQSGTGTR